MLDTSNYTMLQTVISNPEDNVNLFNFPKFSRPYNVTYDIKVSLSWSQDPLSTAEYKTSYTFLITDLTVYVVGGNRMQAFSKKTDLLGVVKDIDEPFEL